MLDCPFCEKMWLGSVALASHIVTEHPNLGPWGCTLRYNARSTWIGCWCGRLFAAEGESDYVWEQHLRAVKGPAAHILDLVLKGRKDV